MLTIIIIITTVITSFVCFSRKDLLYKLSLNPYSMVHHREWSRFITHGFVHADTLHLFVNMFTLWSFGTYMEEVFEIFQFSSFAYLGLYFGGMIFASVYDVFKYKNFPHYDSIGASGAVSAVLFSYILIHPWGGISLFAIIPVPAIIFGVLYLFYCQYMARNSADNINHNAHFFGALYGFLFPLLLKPTLLIHFLEELLSFSFFR